MNRSLRTLGSTHRREARFASPHFASPGSYAVTTLNPQMPPGFDGPARILLNRTNYSASSAVSLNGVVQPLSGSKAHVWSNWIYSGTNTWPIGFSTSVSTDYGFDLEAYEVQMKQYGVWWGWPALRFPGQYYDPETELHENWNRYYDPQKPGYLSPEPMLESPEWPKQEAEMGVATPVYAYATNNPIAWVDSDGLSPGDKNGGSTCERGYYLLKYIKECKPARGICVKKATWRWRTPSDRCERCLEKLPKIKSLAMDQSAKCQSALDHACDDLCGAPSVCSFGPPAPGPN